MKKFWLILMGISLIVMVASIFTKDVDNIIHSAFNATLCVVLYEIKCLKEGD